MNRKPTYNELEQGVKELTKETIDSRLIEKVSKESSEQMKLFAYSVVHDLKSAAIALYSLTERLQKDYSDIVDEKGQRYCEQILRTAEQIATLVEQINVFFRPRKPL